MEDENHSNKKKEIIQKPSEPPKLDKLDEIFYMTEDLEKMDNLTHNELKKRRKFMMWRLEKLKRFMNAFYLSYKPDNSDFDFDNIDFDFDEVFTAYENESPMIYYATIRNTLTSFDGSYLKKMDEKKDHPKVKKFYEIYKDFYDKLYNLWLDFGSSCS